ncbi:hypothetical protein FR932_17645 [Moritella marina ATCC 15381]|uniref:Uncharacterized protein n=1 Tax=Moritella marina ATCC 15381 TaxID=1202962 RepID=A0A5J6WN08_MORMI|nr:hypothetical protein [Moritella marina]QFI39523.1 hypothetical protein FR932_17645 [Moritella marina ATCC 15381]
MFIFKCEGFNQEQATIQVASLLWTESGEVTFNANDDSFACLLLTQCKSDSGGFFNLLAGCKPLYIEQWLEYLEEKQLIKKIVLQQVDYKEADYPLKLGFDDENASTLLDMLYKIGNFNRLQVSRYLKNRNNITYLSTKYDKKDLQRYQQLGKAITFILKLKK